MPRQYRQQLPNGQWWTRPLRNTRCAAVSASSGVQCRRHTFRHPYCRDHARRLLGVRIAGSTIPHAGCGLFADRPFRTGDVVVPYTGTYWVRATQAPPPQTPYMFGYQGHLMDATEVRGVASYVNQPRGSATGRSNLRVTVATILDGHFEPAADTDGGYRAVRRGGRLWRLGWRRIPAVLVRDFAGRSLVWFVATRVVAAGTELHVPYNNAVNVAIRHRTWPRTC
jgi:hypothetical protein